MIRISGNLERERVVRHRAYARFIDAGQSLESNFAVNTEAVTASIDDIRNGVVNNSVTAGALFRSDTNKHPIANDNYMLYCARVLHHLDRYGIVLLDGYFSEKIVSAASRAVCYALHWLLTCTNHRSSPADILLIAHSPAAVQGLLAKKIWLRLL